VPDTFSRRVVGWSIDSTQTTSLVLNALGMATQRRPDRDGLVIHSDRGTQGEFTRSSQCLDESRWRWAGLLVG
jgi:putative transposase